MAEIERIDWSQTSYAELDATYFSQNRPVIITGFPFVDNEAFIRRMLELELPPVKKMRSYYSSGPSIWNVPDNWTMKDYYRAMHGEGEVPDCERFGKAYLVAMALEGAIQPLMDMLNFPDFPNLFEPGKNPYGFGAEVFLGTKGTPNVRRMHFDDNAVEVFSYTVEGCKRFDLVSPEDAHILYPKAFDGDWRLRLSGLDFKLAETADTPLAEAEIYAPERYPRFEENRHLVHKATIGPGEMAYIPPFWWHTAQNEEPSVTIVHRRRSPRNRWRAMKTVGLIKLGAKVFNRLNRLQRG